MTIIWFVVWIIVNNVGDPEALRFDPVNFWAGALLLAVALDLSGHHAQQASSRPARKAHT